MNPTVALFVYQLAHFQLSFINHLFCQFKYLSVFVYPIVDVGSFTLLMLGCRHTINGFVQCLASEATAYPYRHTISIPKWLQYLQGQKIQFGFLILGWGVVYLQSFCSGRSHQFFPCKVCSNIHHPQ